MGFSERERERERETETHVHNVAVRVATRLDVVDEGLRGCAAGRALAQSTQGREKARHAGVPFFFFLGGGGSGCAV